MKLHSINYRFSSLLLLCTVAGAISTIALAGDDEPLAVDASIRNAVGQVEASLPKSPLKRAQFKMELPLRPNAPNTEIDSLYEPLGNGLWGVMSTLRRPNGTGAQQLVTVCGMFDALAATSTNLSTNLTGIMPIGKIFVPFGMKKSFAADSLARITKFDVDPVALCQPVAGSSFDYAVQTEVQYTVSPGPTASPKTTVVTLKGQCEASQRMPAIGLLGGLRGDYIEVTCSGSNDAGRPLSRKFAYLVDSALYLLLETKSDANSFKYTLLNVDIELSTPNLSLNADVPHAWAAPHAAGRRLALFR